jgi:hypothetical protein
MYFRLAAHLGKTVAQLDRELSRDEFVEWCAFYEYEPFGCEPEDNRWRQFYNLFWLPNFKGDAPAFLQRYPVDEVDEIDPVMLMLEARIASQEDGTTA